MTENWKKKRQKNFISQSSETTESGSETETCCTYITACAVMHNKVHFKSTTTWQKIVGHDLRNATKVIQDNSWNWKQYHLSYTLQSIPLDITKDFMIISNKKHHRFNPKKMYNLWHWNSRARLTLFTDTYKKLAYWTFKIVKLTLTSIHCQRRCNSKEVCQSYFLLELSNYSREDRQKQECISIILKQ